MPSNDFGNYQLNFILKFLATYPKIFELKFGENVRVAKRALHYKRLIGG
jgi:hypothetical protein